MMSILLFLITMLPSFGAGMPPSQPLEYVALRDSFRQPFLSYSFRQGSCAQGNAHSDIDASLTLTRLPAASTCPRKSAFNNAIAGFTVNQTQERNAIKSEPINSVFSALTADSGPSETKSMSIETWFSFTNPPGNNTQYTLLEVGMDDQSDDDTGAAENNLRIAYKKLSGPFDDIMQVKYAFYTGTNNVGPLPGEGQVIHLDGAFESIGDSPPDTIFLLIVTVSGENLINVHVAPMGANQANSSSIPGSLPGVNVRRFEFSQSSVLRVGCTRSVVAPPNSGARTGIPGSIHFLAFYDYVLNNTEVETILKAGLPNSVPAVRSAAVFLFEDDASKVVNLNQTGILVLDVDGNPITRFRIRSSPPGQLLRYDNIPITIPDFPIENANLLTFQHNLPPNNFSVANDTMECDHPLATFTFDATDGLCDDPTLTDPGCYSVNVAMARICVKDTQDLPTSNDTVVEVRAGGIDTFILEVYDADDFKIGLSDGKNSTFRSHDTKDTYVPGTLVKFNQTSGSLGDIVFFDGTACNGTTITDGELASFVQVQDSPLKHAFKFCFESKPDAPIGASVTYSFQFQDSAGGLQQNPSLITFKMVNPLSACRDDESGASGHTPCQSSGNEGTLILIRLNGTDAIGGRPLRFKLTSLPSYGTLFKWVGGQTSDPTDANKGDAVVVGDEFLQSSPFLVYEPKPNYFNRVSYDGNTFVYKNREDQGIDGCLAFGSCRCPVTTGIGCPDTFKYKVLANEASSDEGVYNILVNGVASDFLPYKAPETFTFFTAQRFSFTGNMSIEIFDPDDSTYDITVNFDATPGSIGWTSNVTGDPDFRFSIGNDKCPDIGCSDEVEIYSSTAKVNRALSTLFFSSASALPINSTALIKVFKPRPYGTTEDNKFTPDKDAFQQQIKMIIVTGDRSEGGASGLEIAIYAGAGAVAFLALLCCCSACVWFTRKTQQTAKMVRQSIASRRSQSIRQSTKENQRAIDEEDLSQNSGKSRNGGLPCCCCFLGGGVVDQPAKEALSRQRQSMASHRSSHHSIKSHGKERLSTSMTAYQQPEHAPESPNGGREVVAPSLDGQELQVADDSVFAWEKHIDRRTGDVYFFNPRTGVSQWDPPTIKVKRTGK